MQALRQWWDGLGERDRRILQWGGGTAAVLLLVFGLWLPLEDALEREKARYAGLQRSLAEMRSQAARVARLRQQGVDGRTVPSAQSLIATLEQQIDRAGLKDRLKRMQPEGEHRLRLQFQSVPFDRLIPLLQQLVREQGITIASFSITPAGKPGLVDARLVLERGH